MRWRPAGTATVLLLMMTGCPEEFGKGGRIDRAAHKDSLEVTRRRCSDEDRAKFCDGGRQNTEECHRACGE